MIRTWQIAIVIISLGFVGCTEMDAGKGLDGLTTAPDEPARQTKDEATEDQADTTTEDANAESASNDSAYRKAKKELTEASEALQDLAAQEKDEFVKQIDTQLQELDASTAKIQEQAKEMKGEAREKIDQRLADIAAKRQQLVDRMKQLSESSGNAWEEFREGVRNAWDELKKSRDDASGGIDVSVGDGVDVKVGNGVKVDVGKDGVDVNVTPPDASSTSE